MVMMISSSSHNNNRSADATRGGDAGEYRESAAICQGLYSVAPLLDRMHWLYWLTAVAALNNMAHCGEVCGH